MAASISSLKRPPSGYFQRNIRHYIDARNQAQASIKAACANFSNSNVNVQ